MSGLKIEPGDDGTAPLPGIPDKPRMPLREALHKKFCEAGKGVVLYEVPDQVGMSGTNYCDAVAIGMWASSGRRIHGMEVKSSRSDWLRELRMVDKADRFLTKCDHWWLITTAEGIAKADEIPAAWGWMSLKRTGLRVEKPAPSIQPHDGNLSRNWAFALIRRAAERDSEEVARAVTAERERMSARYAQDREYWEGQRGGELKRLQENLDAFEKAAGFKIGNYRGGDLGDIVNTIQNLSHSGIAGFMQRVERESLALTVMARDLKGLAETLGKQFNSAPTKEGIDR